MLSSWSNYYSALTAYKINQTHITKNLFDEIKKHYMKKELKMTREEAEKKLAAIKVPRDINGRYHIIDVMEALGLIKFDEPMREYESNYKSMSLIQLCQALNVYYDFHFSMDMNDRVRINFIKNEIKRRLESYY